MATLHKGENDEIIIIIIIIICQLLWNLAVHRERSYSK